MQTAAQRLEVSGMQSRNEKQLSMGWGGGNRKRWKREKSIMVKDGAFTVQNLISHVRTLF